MPPKPGDVWNKRLVRALTTRNLYQQGKSGRTFQWEKGSRIIEAVGKDIYLTRTGKVCNLPKDLGSQTVMQEVMAIIKGEKPVVPPEMAAFDPERPDFVMPAAVEDLSQHSYLRNMRFRGGGYALLMAFEEARRSRGADYRGPMFRKQLISRAQPFCDEPMENNYFAGRVISGWKSMERLVEHLFVEKEDKFADRREARFNRGPQDEFCLTDKGAKFIEAVLNKFPTEFNAAPHDSGSAGGVRQMEDDEDDLESLNDSPQRKRGPSASPGKSFSGNLFRKDEAELREWAATATPGDEKEFRVGKDRRHSLHRICELIGGLKKQSFGEGRQRTLMVTKESTASNLAAGPRSLDPRAKSNVERRQANVERRPAARATAAIPNRQSAMDFLQANDHLFGLDAAAVGHSELDHRPGQASGNHGAGPQLQDSGVGYRLGGQASGSSPGVARRADKDGGKLTPREQAVLAAEKRRAEAQAQQQQPKPQPQPQPQSQQLPRQQQQQQRTQQLRHAVINEEEEEEEDEGVWGDRYASAGVRGGGGGAGARRELAMESEPNSEMGSEDEDAMMAEAIRMSLEESGGERAGGGEGGSNTAFEREKIAASASTSSKPPQRMSSAQAQSLIETEGAGVEGRAGGMGGGRRDAVAHVVDAGEGGKGKTQQRKRKASAVEAPRGGPSGGAGGDGPGEDAVVVLDDSSGDEEPDRDRHAGTAAKRLKVVDLCDSSDDDGGGGDGGGDGGCGGPGACGGVAEAWDSASSSKATGAQARHGEEHDVVEVAGDSQDVMELVQEGSVASVDGVDVDGVVGGSVEGARNGRAAGQQARGGHSRPVVAASSRGGTCSLLGRSSDAGAGLPVRVLVDGRERMRNKAPRELMYMMQSALEQTVDDAGQRAAQHRPAAMATLPVGDYLFEFMPGEVADADGEEEEEEEGGEPSERVLASVVIERKRISDLVGRSLDGDHLKQTVVLRGLGFEYTFLLLEGKAESAKKSRVFGLDINGEEAVAGAAEGSSIVQTGEDVWELVAYTIVCDRQAGGRGPASVKVLQTEHEEHSARAIAVLSSLIARGPPTEGREVVEEVAKSAERRGADGSNAREEGEALSDEDEEARFLALMDKHASPRYQASKAVRAAGPARAPQAASESAAAKVSMAELKTRLKQVRGDANRLEKAMCGEGFRKGVAKAVVARFGAGAEVVRGESLVGSDNLFSVADMKSFRDPEARSKLLACCTRIEDGMDEEREREACRESLRRSTMAADGDGRVSVADRPQDAGSAGCVFGREIWVRWSDALRGLMRAEGQPTEGPGIKSESCAGREAGSKGWAWMRCERVMGGEHSASTPLLLVRLTGDQVVAQMLEAGVKVGDDAPAAQIALQCARSVAALVQEVVVLAGMQGRAVSERGPGKEMVVVLLEGLWTACKKEQRKGTQKGVVRRLLAEGDYLRLYLSMWGPRLLGGPSRAEAWQVVCSCNRKETATALQAVVGVVHTQAMLFPTADPPT